MSKLANAAAEQTLIGTLICDAGSIDAVADRIGPQDFADPRLGTIYAATARLALAGRSGGAALVEELRSAGELDMVGGDSAVAYLESKADPDRVAETCTIVRDLAVKRERAQRAQLAAQIIASGGDATVELEALANQDPTVDADGWTDLASVVTAIVAGTHRRLEPTLLQRSDGASLIYQGKLNWIAAPPESMKSWVSKLACVQLLEKGQPAVYVDFEESDGTSCAERVVSIALGRGHSIETVRDWVEGPVTETGTRDASRRLFYYRAATTGLDTSARAQILRIVRNRQVSLVVLDGVAAAMGSHQPPLEEDKSRDVNLWLSGFAHPITALGAGVLCVDHVVKNSSAGAGSFAARSPRGSGAKLAAVSGSALSAKVRTPGSAWTIGEVDLDIVKDRPGRVKVVTRDGRRIAGTLISTPNSDGIVESTHLEILSPEEVAEAAQAKRWDLIAAELMSKTLADAGEPMAKGALKEALNERRREKSGEGWRPATLTAAVSFLVDRGWASCERDGRFEMVGHVKAYRAEYGEINAADGNPF